MSERERERAPLVEAFCHGEGTRDGVACFYLTFCILVDIVYSTDIYIYILLRPVFARTSNILFKYTVSYAFSRSANTSELLNFLPFFNCLLWNEINVKARLLRKKSVILLRLGIEFILLIVHELWTLFRVSGPYFSFFYRRSYLISVFSTRSSQFSFNLPRPLFSLIVIV